ncbi:hypothetical protein [Fictibacillus norfolkensis]|jgi:hypothetical protein|uniref:DUF4181 domain-containing protein n=1 Tax=Fictibacillus norfolkensis TaxID=2762233 RepID=A0ABR8SKD4_9BACL|nr:hypothetical protein [Fictibacillus norfolkensis]MBD7963948.1 hypothetical protein [Fictibacillus norfolkensis]
MNILKRFFFKRSKNNIGELCGLIVILTIIQFVDFKSIWEKPLNYILVILGSATLYRILVEIFEKILGEKNKVVGSRYTFITIFVFVFLVNFIDK